jgi:UDP-N-acetylglucosamine 2-epimerase (non-hydrolysing)
MADARPLVACVVGTRPEAIKMAPVVRRLMRSDSGLRVSLIATGQHAELLNQALANFDLRPDLDLALMRPGQSLGALTARAIEALDAAFERLRPAIVVAQGDTNSVLASALAASYRSIPFAHIEAGLRTGDRSQPFPEETNRVVTSHLAALHFAPTARNKQALAREGILPESVHVVGNTIVDALLAILDRPDPPALPPGVGRFALVTAHRRESFGTPLVDICSAISRILRSHRDLSILFPVHPNPQVREVVTAALADEPRVHLLDPLPYPTFVGYMRDAALILSDSGGVQEEAPSLGTPALVLRNATERPEALATGLVRLVGTDPDAIVSAAADFLLDPPPRPATLPAPSPFGDGQAAVRIAWQVKEYLKTPTASPGW